MNTIAKNIKKYRVNANLTQEQLAEKMNLTRQAISNWENEKTCPDIDSIMKLAEVLNIDVMLILYGSAYKTDYVKITPEYRKQNRILLIILVIDAILFLPLIAHVTWLRNRLYLELCSYLLPILIYLFCGSFAVTLGLLIGNILEKICPTLSVPESRRWITKVIGAVLIAPVALLTLQALLLLVWHDAPQPINVILSYFLMRKGMRYVMLIILPVLGGVFIGYGLHINALQQSQD